MRGRAWFLAGVAALAVVGVPALDAHAGSKTCDVFQDRISTDWFTAGNWSLHHVPTTADSVCLPNKQDPVIDSDTQTAEAGTLTVSNPGVFSASTPIDRGRAARRSPQQEAGMKPGTVHDGTFTTLEHAQAGSVTYTPTEVDYAPTS